MKNSFIIFLLLSLFCCKQEKSALPVSYLHRVVDTLDMNRSENILIYTINPNDCISCLNAFKFFDDELNGSSGSKMYVIKVDRKIEKEAFQKQMTYPDLSPQKNKVILWGRDLFNNINHCGGVDQAMTTVIVYNYQRDSILFSKPAREIIDMKEIRAALGTEIQVN